jgi:hypothetical protein
MMVNACKTAANLAGVLIIVLPALIAINYLSTGTLVFVVLSYVMWSLAKSTNLWFGFKRYRPYLVYNFLSTYEKSIHKQFALYVRHPALAFFFSTTLHWLRVAAVAWIAVSLWQGLYIASIALVFFCVLSSGTISTMFPDLYFEDAAKRGNHSAAEMLRALRYVQDILTPNTDHVSPQARQTAEWKSNRAEVEKEVTETIKQRPDVAADLFIGSGELYGNKLRQRFTLRADDLTDAQKAALPKHYVSPNGLPVDEVAKLFGYGSGDAMIERMIGYNAFKGDRSSEEFIREIIKEETDYRMERKYGLAPRAP